MPLLIGAFFCGTKHVFFKTYYGNISNIIKTTIIMSPIGLHLIFKFLWRIFNPFIRDDIKPSILRFFIMLLFIFFYGILQLVNRLFLALDNIFFVSYKKIDIVKPVFIVGVPRSGTTFMHNILSEDKKNFTTCTLGEMLFAPSIIQKLFFQKFLSIDNLVGSPFKKFILFIESHILRTLNKRHETGLKAPEEDFLLLLPHMACFLLVIPFPYKEMWDLAFFNRAYDNRTRKKIMSIYKNAIQRHMYVYGKNRTYLSKNASFCGWIKDLKDTFPDISLICCIRPPDQTIPSILSIMKKGWGYFKTNLNIENMHANIIHMMEYYCNCILTQDKINSNTNWLVLPMSKMQNHLEDTIKLIYVRFNFNLRKNYFDFVKKEADISRGYISKHDYKKDLKIIKTSLVDRFKNFYSFYDLKH